MGPLIITNKPQTPANYTCITVPEILEPAAVEKIPLIPPNKPQTPAIYTCITIAEILGVPQVNHTVPVIIYWIPPEGHYTSYQCAYFVTHVPAEDNVIPMISQELQYQEPMDCSYFPTQ